MRCLMDVRDDEIQAEQNPRYQRRDPSTFRRLGCGCDVQPEPSRYDYGCRCPDCGKTCRECPGHGWVIKPTQKWSDVVVSVKNKIRSSMRRTGAPPPMLRLSQTEIDVVVAKWHNEDDDHHVKLYVNPGPPLRIFDIPVVQEPKE